MSRGSAFVWLYSFDNLLFCNGYFFSRPFFFVDTKHTAFLNTKFSVYNAGKSHERNLIVTNNEHNPYSQASHGLLSINMERVYGRQREY